MPKPQPLQGESSPTRTTTTTTTSSSSYTNYWMPKPNPKLEYYKKVPLFRLVRGQCYVRKTLDRGVFTCPACETEQSFKHKNIALKPHVCWIPVGAGQDKGEYIKCGNCHLHFRNTVLLSSSSTTESRQQKLPQQQHDDDKAHKEEEDPTHNTDEDDGP